MYNQVVNLRNHGKLYQYSCMILLVFSTLLSAATYYVSNSGDDTNNGTTPGTAFATCANAKSKLKARDTLLLNRGDIFRDSLNLSTIADPAIGCYGPADSPKPIISGSVAIAPWSVHNGSVWVASCDKGIEKLFTDNTLMPLARYPDTGWLRIDTMTEDNDGSNTIIKVAALTSHPNNSAGYWNKAQIRWRRWSWWFETRQISSYDGSGTLALDGKSIIHIALDSKGWGFYIDNKFEEISSPGEWFYDSSAKKVYLYPPGGVDPNTLLVEGACLSTGIELAGGTVSDINFRHQTKYGLSLARTSTISRCCFEGIGGDEGGSALRATWDIADSRIVDNVFKNNLNIGISWYENSGKLGKTIIERDTLINTGTFPGYGGSGTWHAVGILVHLSANVRVRNNYIDRTGYAGILLGSDSNFVQYNIIKNAMWTLNDGAAIYTDCSKSFIRNNIIYDTRGNLESSGPWYPLSHGIWLEYLGEYRESVVENNTIVHSGCYGIYLRNNFSCTIKNNVLFNNDVAQMKLDGRGPGNRTTARRGFQTQDNLLTGNVYYAASKEQKSLLFRPEYDYGTLGDNYFCNPYTDSVVSGYGTGTTQWIIYNYTLDQWQTLFSWADKTPKTDPFKRPSGISENNPYGKGKIFINETISPQNFSLGPTVYKTLDGTDITGSVSVPAFSSKILVQADSIVGIKTFEKNELVQFKMKSTGMCYTLHKGGAVSLALYSLAGRQVYRFYHAMQTPGTYSINYVHPGNSEVNLASGVYSYIFSITSKKTALQKVGKCVIVR